MCLLISVKHTTDSNRHSRLRRYDPIFILYKALQGYNQSVYWQVFFLFFLVFDYSFIPFSIFQKVIIFKEYEKFARKSKNNLVELGYAVKEELRKLNRKTSNITEDVEKFRSRFAEQLQ